MDLKSKNEEKHGFRDMKMSKRDLRIFYNSEKQIYINKKELNINYERTCLKVCFDNFTKRMTTYFLSAVALLFTCFALIVLMCVISFTAVQTLIVSTILFVDVAFSINYLRKKFHEKEYKKRVHYEACLLALNDIEEEFGSINRNRTLTQRSF